MSAKLPRLPAGGPPAGGPTSRKRCTFSTSGSTRRARICPPSPCPGHGSGRRSTSSGSMYASRRRSLEGFLNVNGFLETLAGGFHDGLGIGGVRVDGVEDLLLGRLELLGHHEFGDQFGRLGTDQMSAE